MRASSGYLLPARSAAALIVLGGINILILGSICDAMCADNKEADFSASTQYKYILYCYSTAAQLRLAIAMIGVSGCVAGGLF